MRVVLESIDENLARLVPDDKSDEIIISKALLPKTSKVGDVLEMMLSENKTATDYTFELLTDETKKRMRNNRKKREKLLKKTPKPFE